MILDQEVFAVLVAISVIASIVGVAMILRPDTPEPFSVIALLNEDCKLGDLPRTITANSSLKLCIFLSNNMGKPIYYKVVYRIGDRMSIPSKENPSNAPVLSEWFVVLDNKANITIPINVRVMVDPPLPSNASLIFELWRYDTSTSSWVYTGLWVHHFVTVTVPIVPR